MHKLTMIPYPLPHFRSRSTFLISKVGPNLDMATEDDWTGRILFLSNLDEARHLGVVDNDDIGSTLLTSGERATVFCPLALLRLVHDPGVEGLDLLLSKTLAVLGDSLEDVVVVLGDAENVSFSKRNVPNLC
jgi:hypothetical protein